jgi:thioredoxin reductase (NADPH)
MSKSDALRDVIIIGAGAAGLTAGIYASRSKRSTLIMDKKRAGGQAATTESMENYPGFPGGIGGRQLLDRFKQQAEEMGSEFAKDEVLAIEEREETYALTCKSETVYEARSLILAPGCQPRKLGIPGETEFTGRGVSYCATCDAELYEETTVVVIGSGDTAVEEATYLSRFADTVVMIVVHDEGVLDCTASIAEEAFENEKLYWKWNTAIEEIDGDDLVERVKVRNLRTGEEEWLECDGVFMFVGTIPQTSFLSGFVDLQNGFIKTDATMQTNRRLVYAAGDARAKNLRQVVTAASDGATAAFFADKALTEIDEYTRAIERAGNEYLLYFYFPAVQRSLDLFPEVEKKAKDYNLNVIKLDTSRYKTIAGKYNIDTVPTLLRVENSTIKETIPI